MPKPEGVPACPPGLEYLTQIDQLLIHQQIELLEALTGWEVKNRYQIKNTLGQQVYFAQEESTTCHRQCCGGHRKFDMSITDNLGTEVIRMHRPFKCCGGDGSCWCGGIDACSDELTVESPPGTVVGKVKYAFSKWSPHLEIRDAADNVVLHVWGPCCPCQAVCCTGDIDYKLYSKDMQTEVGKISKQWAGAMKEILTKADNFGVNFPVDLDVNIKAVLIGATFLVEFLFSEEQ